MAKKECLVCEVSRLSSADLLVSFIGSEKRDITDEKQALKDALVELEDALTAQQFLSLGDEPNIGDLYVYGVLRGLEGLQVHQEVVGDNKQISMWYERMRKMVEEGALK